MPDNGVSTPAGATRRDPSVYLLAVTDIQLAALVPVLTRTTSTCLVWRKSSRSTNNGCCVEVAEQPGAVAVRDSKDPDGAMLRFQSSTWSHFIAGVKAGEFDLPTC